MKRFWLLIIILICTVTMAHGVWYEPPGGVAAEVNDTDHILIEQNGISRSATRYQFVTGVKSGEAVSKDTFKTYTGVRRATLTGNNTFTGFTNLSGGVRGGHANKPVCWKADGKTFGYYSSVAGGVCR